MVEGRIRRNLNQLDRRLALANIHEPAAHDIHVTQSLSLVIAAVLVVTQRKIS